MARWGPASAISCRPPGATLTLGDRSLPLGRDIRSRAPDEHVGGGIQWR